MASAASTNSIAVSAGTVATARAINTTAVPFQSLKLLFGVLLATKFLLNKSLSKKLSMVNLGTDKANDNKYTPHPNNSKIQIVG